MLPKLYVIIDRETLDRRGLRIGAFAKELADAGVMLVQYRDKVSGPQEVLRAAAQISKAFAGTDARLVMNDRADMAMLAGWDGVHVGQGDLPVGIVRKMLGFVGISTHNEEQVGGVGDVDYVAVGPVYGTMTKLDAQPVVGLKGVRRARALTQRPLVAIGGITLENAASVMEAGADSVAVISGVFVPGRTVGGVVRDFLDALR